MQDIILIFVSQFEFKMWTCSKWRNYVHVIMYKCRSPLFKSIQHKFNCDIRCCVECTNIVFLDASCYPDVGFHSYTEGRDTSSSRYATSLSVTTCELKYDVKFVTSA